MKSLWPVLGLVAVVLPLAAGDVTVHAVVTKKLTKKGLSPIAYNLRGTALPADGAEVDGHTEYDRMVVILEGDGGGRKPPETAVLNQKGTKFDPEILVLPVGSTVQFPNWDPIFHNVFSLSKAQSFDLGFYPQGQSRSVKFNRAGIVQVYCHIHANMYAAIVVTSSPWYGKPGADGSFSWSGVPGGHYRLTAWHKIAGLFKTELDVPASGHVEASIQVPVDAERP